jgi:DNA polymerase elongation subunit (family B)
MLPLIQREHSLSSYTLNSVSEHFLKDQKEDVPHSHIATLFRGNPDDVARLGKYCVKDSVLPLRLMRHLCTLVNQIEMSRVTGVTLTSLVTRGQQYKVFAQICRHTHKHQYVVPYVPPPAAAVAPADKSKPKPVDLFGNHESDSESDADDEAETLDSATTYQGATVIDAETGT